MDSFLEKLEKIHKERVQPPPPPAALMPAAAAPAAPAPAVSPAAPADASAPVPVAPPAEGKVSFLEKLKVKKAKTVAPVAPPVQEGASLDILQLDVDMYQTPFEVVIYALVPGVAKTDLDISIEKEGDVVTIRGKKKRPEKWKECLIEEEGSKKFMVQECKWGSFFRQITLPAEINILEVQAKLDKGVLILWLPLLRTSGKRKVKKKLEVTELSNDGTFAQMKMQ